MEKSKDIKDYLTERMDGTKIIGTNFVKLHIVVVGEVNRRTMRTMIDDRRADFLG